MTIGTSEIIAGMGNAIDGIGTAVMTAEIGALGNKIAGIAVDRMPLRFPLRSRKAPRREALPRHMLRQTMMTLNGRWKPYSRSQQL